MGRVWFGNDGVMQAAAHATLLGEEELCAACRKVNLESTYQPMEALLYCCLNR
jgi:hypothetical protein